MSFITAKNGHIGLPEKRALPEVKHIYFQSAKFYGISLKECDKIHCEFCFLSLCCCHKILKNSSFFLQTCADYLSLSLQHACDCKTIESHLKSQTWSLKKELYSKS